jgi:hypothetical protein
MPFLRRAYVSDSDPRYGFASISDRHCVYTVGYFLLRRRPGRGRWHILYAVPDSAQSCSEFRHRVPGPVLGEFDLEEGVTGECWLGGPFNGL